MAAGDQSMNIFEAELNRFCPQKGSRDIDIWWQISVGHDHGSGLIMICDHGFHGGENSRNYMAYSCSASYMFNVENKNVKEGIVSTVWNTNYEEGCGK